MPPPLPSFIFLSWSGIKADSFSKWSPYLALGEATKTLLFFFSPLFFSFFFEFFINQSKHRFVSWDNPLEHTIGKCRPRLASTLILYSNERPTVVLQAHIGQDEDSRHPEQVPGRQHQQQLRICHPLDLLLHDGLAWRGGGGALLSVVDWLFLLSGEYFLM